MKKQWFSVIALSLALGAIGCGNSNSTEYKPVPPKEPDVVTVQAGEERTLFPLTVGNRWSYDAVSIVQTQAGTIRTPATLVLEVKEVTTEGDVTKATVDVFKGEVLQDRQLWVINNSGMYQEQTGLDKPLRPDPMQLALPFPIEVDKVVSWAGKAPGPDNKVVDVNQEVVNKGIEDVDTIVGMMKAYRVETTQRLKVGNEDVTVINVSWWAPKIGLVRYQQEAKAVGRVLQSQTLKLQQHTVK